MEELYGYWRSDDSYTALEPMLLPCATQIEYVDGTLGGGHDDCEWDQTKVQEYLNKAPSALILYNTVEFD